MVIGPGGITISPHDDEDVTPKKTKSNKAGTHKRKARRS